jgi:hypothetical protein
MSSDTQAPVFSYGSSDVVGSEIILGESMEVAIPIESSMRLVELPREATDDDVAAVVQFCPNLQQLVLSSCFKITDATLNHIRAVPLELLHASSSQITDAGLANLAGTQLQNISLFRCANLTDAGLQHLSRLPRLTSLDLRECPGVTEAGVLRHLPGLPALQYLYYSGGASNGMNVTDKPLWALAKARHAAAAAAAAADE